MQLKVSHRSNISDFIEIELAGAKNALLHLLFASLLPETATVFYNVSTTLHDYHGVCDILSEIGAKVNQLDKSTVQVLPPSQMVDVIVPVKQTHKTRTSLMLLGALAKQVKSLKIGYPGGCSFSDQRPFDIHLQGLEALGAHIVVDEYSIYIESIEEKNAQFCLRYPSVGASINLMLYAALGKSQVVLENVALEPEVIEVASFLNQCGATIRLDHKHRRMFVTGMKRLSGVEFSIMYDRIQVMSYAALAYLHKTDVKVKYVSTKEYIARPLQLLKAIGAKWQFDAAKQELVFLGKSSHLRGASIVAKPYPDFPTDLQPIFAVMLSVAENGSSIVDTVYPERIKYVFELQKIGFPITYHDHMIHISPLNQTKLHGASMQSFDLRAGMALVMAASLCDQACLITKAQQVFRGYENLLENMSNFMHIAVDREYYEL
ncbi:UDP-N-acetylglucosamine 1-carboxyvinyltransferase [Facilibium subflavum]|uniref:UDP-N-acetylglucosamine 1-carboxyvinyltransferase n=1 Tax=Facilibium subflavum TaxID=2219058 RepID=UPI001F23BAA8|nr:UDP-N-acetylglucosamine 1-carboxyvinyltransferase [Facilibium subflavum]